MYYSHVKLFILISVDELGVFTNIAEDNFQKINSDIEGIYQEFENVLAKTQESVEECKSIAEEESAEDCFVSVRDTLNVDKTVVLEIAAKVASSGSQVLDGIAEELEYLIETDNQYVSDTSKSTAEQIEKCNQN